MLNPFNTLSKNAILLKKEVPMAAELLQDFFMWCSIIHLAMMGISAILIIQCRDWVYTIHSRWFNLSKEAFDLALYSFLGLYKLLIIIFCIVPWIALSILL
jgi:hypothetical protein